MKLMLRVAIVMGLIVFSSSIFGLAGNNPHRRSKRAQSQLKIEAKPWGPTQADIDAARSRVEKSLVFQSTFAGVVYHFISFELLDNSTTAKIPQPANRYRITYYDYTNGRTFVAYGDFAGNGAINLQRDFSEPNLGAEELNAAFQVVKGDAVYASLAAQGQLLVEDAMPPVSQVNKERLVNVSITNTSTGGRQIAGVSLKTNQLVYYKNNAPPTSKAASDSCGIVNSNQGSNIQGLAGQYQFTVRDTSNNTLWEMLINRPSISSGPRGSGIELLNVRYKGKTVFAQAHVPFLNIKYANTCGPFLDWQWAEGFFNAPSAGATDPAPGFRVLAPGQIATTAIETDNDVGNFQGVAAYVQGSEAVLVTEMNAGWYRYIMEWRFGADGTIRPRFGFGAVQDSCVCIAHYHHVYWRFDFDIVQPNDNVFRQERGGRFLAPIRTETGILRDRQKNRSILVQNGSGDEAYILVPGIADGNYNDGDPTFGRGDFWILRTHPGELGAFDPNDASIDMSGYLNGESLINSDVTVWYGAHFTHADGANTFNADRSPKILSGDHVVGPDLRPIRW